MSPIDQAIAYLRRQKRAGRLRNRSVMLTSDSLWVITVRAESGRTGFASHRNPLTAAKRAVAEVQRKNG